MQKTKNIVKFCYMFDNLIAKNYYNFKRTIMISIAIDGYSGSGKGELSKGLAKKLKLKHLDTGAILRAMGLYFHKKGLSNVTPELFDEHFNKINVRVEFEGDKQITYLNDSDVSGEIRTEAIGAMASKVALCRPAMLKTIEISQAFAKQYDCVLDGRNITSEVLPNADVKFFLDANLECRAMRRHKEALARGQESNYDEVLNSLSERDWRDTHRDFSRMIKTDDSFVIDNSDLTIEQTVDKCLKIATEKLKKLGKLKA